MKKLPNWNVWNDDHIIEMLWYLSNYYGDDCTDCKTICCTNQNVYINREEIKTIAKHIKMDVNEFRFKYTLLRKNLIKYVEKKYGEKVISESLSKIEKQRKEVGGRILSFDFADGKKMRGGNKCIVSYCSFYNKKTHRCTIYNARPNACRVYPYQRVDGLLDIRKPNTCSISRGFLKKVSIVAKIMNEKYDKKSDEYQFNNAIKHDIDMVLKSKEYENHFYLPWGFILIFLWNAFGVIEEEKIASDIMERLQEENILEIRIR